MGEHTEREIYRKGSIKIARNRQIALQAMFADRNRTENLSIFYYVILLLPKNVFLEGARREVRRKTENIGEPKIRGVGRPKKGGGIKRGVPQNGKVWNTFLWKAPGSCKEKPA